MRATCGRCGRGFNYYGERRLHTEAPRLDPEQAHMDTDRHGNVYVVCGRCGVTSGDWMVMTQQGVEA